MANVPKAITDLPVASAMGDDDLLVVSQNATTSSIKGELIKGYAQNAVASQVTAAQTAANQAGQSATQAEAARQGAAAAQTAAESAQDAAETARDQSVAAAGTVGDSVEQAQDAASQASSAKDAAVAAQTAAEAAKTAAETASGQAQTAATQASGSATAAQTAATQAGDAKTDAETARNEAETSASSAANSASDAESAATGAEQAKTYIENMDMDGETLPAGSSVTVTKTISPEGNLLFVIGVPQGIQGDKGDTGETGATGPQGVSVTNATVNEDGDLVITLSAGDPINAGSVIGPQGIQGEVGPTGASVDRIERTSGTGAPGTTDTYTVYLTDGQTGGTFQVYNGSNGTGSGDFMADGSVPMTGDLQMGGHVVTGMADGTEPTDGATVGQLAGKLDSPDGGTAGQVLTKTSDGSAWEDAPSGLPDGGTEGQMLYKTADGTAWGNPVGKTDQNSLDSTGEIFNDYERNEATGEYSHAEGWRVKASGDRSHAEGDRVKASGKASHAEGMFTIASGDESHSEGSNNVASGNSSHAEGLNTIASGMNQHVQGKYNIEDNSDIYAHIVGNGNSENTRSNAHTLDWDGNAWFSGDVFVGGTSQSSSERLMKTPSGGTTGQVLTKTSTGEEWSDAPSGLPEGGTEGQVIKKTADGAEWDNADWLPLNGGTMSGDIAMGGHKITNLGAPTNANDAVRQADLKVVSDEVDGIIAGTTGITLAPATTTKIGGVIVGDGIEVEANGTISVTPGLTQEQADERYLQLSGGTMTGAINFDFYDSSNITWKEFSQGIPTFGFRTSHYSDGSVNEFVFGIREDPIINPVIVSNISSPKHSRDAANKAYVDSKAPTSVTITLSSSSWSSNTQTVTVSGVSATETAQLITPTPAIASQSAYYEAGIMCTGQAANSLTFTCQTVPTSTLTVYVVIQPLG